MLPLKKKLCFLQKKNAENKNLFGLGFEKISFLHKREKWKFSFYNFNQTYNNLFSGYVFLKISKKSTYSFLSTPRILGQLTKMLKLLERTSWSGIELPTIPLMYISFQQSFSFRLFT